MTDRPILFSAPMVRAILDGRKTMTRRVVKLPSDAREVKYWTTPNGRQQTGYADPGVNYWTPHGNHIDPCPYGFPGDRLWVRESWCQKYEDGRAVEGKAWYAADGNEVIKDDGDGFAETRKDGTFASPWRPSIFMPRWASRITLEIVNVRVERVQDISAGNAKAEGPTLTPDRYDPGFMISHREAFRNLWDSLNAKRGYGWDKDPYVWVIEFKRP